VDGKGVDQMRLKRHIGPGIELPVDQSEPCEYGIMEGGKFVPIFYFDKDGVCKLTMPPDDDEPPQGIFVRAT
jgi:hypothetical protein